MSIGSDAVYAAEEYLANGGKKAGGTAIEQISRVYGAQAVVVSIDPRRVYVAAPGDTEHLTVKTSKPGALQKQWSSHWVAGITWHGAETAWQGRERASCFCLLLVAGIPAVTGANVPAVLLSVELACVHSACRCCRAQRRAVLLVAVHRHGWP